MNFKHSTSEEVKAYLEASQIVALLESLQEKRHAGLAQATAAVDALGTAIKHLKNGKSVKLNNELFKPSELFLVQVLYTAAQVDEAAMKARLSEVVGSLKFAEKDKQYAHEDLLLKATIRQISSGKKGIQVVIQIGGLSVTRHLQATSAGFAGTAFDGSGKVIFDRQLVLGMFKPSAPEQAKAA